LIERRRGAAACRTEVAAPAIGGGAASLSTATPDARKARLVVWHQLGIHEMHPNST
jgi:hypothetical protein